jgi:hypothetical protein
MKKKKPKSLGELQWPNFKMSAFNGGTGRVVITAATPRGDKVIRISGSQSMAFRLVEIAREIATAQRSYATDEWNLYLRLKRETGLVDPDDKAPAKSS